MITGAQNAGQRSSCATISMICHGLNMFSICCDLLCRKKVSIYLTAFFVFAPPIRSSVADRRMGRLTSPRKLELNLLSKECRSRSLNFNKSPAAPTDRIKDWHIVIHLPMCPYPVQQMDERQSAKRSDGRALPKWFSPEIILIKTAHMSPCLLQNKTACRVVPQFLAAMQVQVEPTGSRVTPFQRAGTVIPVGRKRA